MPDDLDTIIDNIHTRYGWVYGDLDYCADLFYNAGGYIYDGNLHQAGQTIQALQPKFDRIKDYIPTRYASGKYYVVDALSWISDNWPDAGDPYVLTMDDILSTMLAASPEQVEYFVGLVDAYRQSIWNKPFNVEYFAALARGFEQWE